MQKEAYKVCLLKFRLGFPTLKVPQFPQGKKQQIQTGIQTEQKTMAAQSPNTNLLIAYISSPGPAPMGSP